MVYDVFFPPASLTLGATYTIQVPAGMLKDIAGNSIAKVNFASFTVLSGVSPAINPYTASTFTSGTPDCSAASACNATVDTTAPTFTSMFPKNGATDVSATSGNAVVMYFSEPVKFNTSGVISIKNSSNIEVGKVNLTTDAIAISPATNATKIPIPAVLTKGMKFTISIPTGIIKDLAGNSLAAITKSFTCLSETADTSAPVAIGMSFAPKAAGTALPTALDVFFSEGIMAGSAGTVSAVGGTVNIQTPITHSNVTVSGFKLSLSVYAGSLSTAGTYDMRVGAGSLKDAAGNLFLGLNFSSMTYVTANADVTKPTLMAQAPVAEATPTFTLPVTSSMKLTFSEAVQAAAGVTAATLTPTFGYKTVSISTADVYLDGTTAVLTCSTLMPGEYYSVTIPSGVFMDTSFNVYAGLSSGYKISTYAGMGFALVSSGNWDAMGYYDGSRYGSAALADPNNVLYMIGGSNGTAGAAATSMLNDVWSYASERESACASSVVPFTCSETTCVSATTLATKKVARTVWRAPTANGAPCVASTGSDARDLWAMVEMGTESCSCPMCLTPPAGTLPTHMTNESYVSAYTLVSAAMGTGSLECVPGKLPNGSFTCVVDSQYIGKFQTPYPNCYPAPCTAPPTTTGILKFTGLTMTGTDGMMNCSALNSTYSMKSGGVCAVTCDTGFTMGKGFECFEGKFNDAVCIPLTPCKASDATVAFGKIDCTEAEYSETCPITCATEEGYSPYKTGATAVCDVASGGVMTFIAPKDSGKTLSGTTDGVCVPTECATPATPANGIGFTKFGKSIKATFGLTCDDGYVVDLSNAKPAVACLKSGLVETPLPTCKKAAGCDGTTLDISAITGAADTGTCVATMEHADTCQPKCGDGLEAVGQYVCSNGKLDGFVNCMDPALAATAVMTPVMSSAFGIGVSLGSVSDPQAMFAGSVSKMLGIPAKEVAKVDVDLQSRRRLFGERRLQAAGYEVGYQAIATDSATLTARAASVGSPGESQTGLLGSLESAGAAPDKSSLKVTKPPATFTIPLVITADGVVAPAPPPIPTVAPPPTPVPTAPTPKPTPTPTPTPTAGPKKEEESSNMGAIIGGVIGGLVALGLIGGAAYYFLVMKKKGGGES
jgi:hypothetical protein